MGNITLISRSKKEGLSSEVFDPTLEYTLVEDFEENTHVERDVFVKIEFEQPICCYANAHYIASKLDTDIRKYLRKNNFSFKAQILNIYNIDFLFSQMPTHVDYHSMEEFYKCGIETKFLKHNLLKCFLSLSIKKREVSSIVWRMLTQLLEKTYSIRNLNPCNHLLEEQSQS